MRTRDPVEAMIAPNRARRSVESPEQPSVSADQSSDSGGSNGTRLQPDTPSEKPAVEPDERIDVRPIGTPQGFKELAALHRKTWSMLNVEEKAIHVALWPFALHFGLYAIKRGQEQKRPPLIGAFWARPLSESPLTLGHLYPASLFRGISAEDVWEFGGLVIDPNYQGKGLVRMVSETAKLFLFSRRPKLIITNPVEPLYPVYQAFGLKTIGHAPVVHPHAHNAKVWLMYGDFEELAKPFFM